MKEKKKRFFIATIAAFVGALIGCIPWILLYVFTNVMYSFLALIVALCSIKFYELFKGKIDKRLSWIIGITSFLAMSISVLIIIPNILMYREYGAITWNNYKLLWTVSEFKSAIIRDYLFSMLFTGIGIFGIITSINAQVKNGSEKVSLNYKKEEVSLENKNKIKNIFLEHNAINKDTLVAKNSILKKNPELEYDFTNLLINGYIKEKKGKYYYNEKAEKTNINKNVVSIIAVVGISVLIGILSGVNSTPVNNSTNKKDNNKIVNIPNVNYSKPDNYVLSYNKDVGYVYVPNTDLSGSSGYISLLLMESQEDFSNYDDVYKHFKELFESSYKVKSSTMYDNKVGNKVIEFDVEFDNYRDIAYFIFKDKKYVAIDAIDYGIDNLTILKDAKNIVDTFDWK